MATYGTIIQQGDFTSDGTDKIIALRSDVDWVEVYNLTNIAAATQWAGTYWYWQREMADDDAVTHYHAAGTQALSASTSVIGYNGAVYRGISLIDSTDKTPGAAVAIAAGVNCPIVDVAKVRPIVLATDLVLNRDHYSHRYIKAFRQRSSH